MENSLWKKLTELHPDDHAMAQIVHSRLYRDGQSCEKRRRAARKLLHAGWSVKHIAKALGRPTSWVFRAVKTNGSGTIGSLGTPTSLTTQETKIIPFRQNYKGSTASKRTKL